MKSYRYLSMSMAFALISSALLASNVKSQECTDVWKNEQEGYELVLKNCSRSDTEVSCHMLVTSKGENREMTIRSRGTRIIGDFGKEYHISSIKSEIHVVKKRSDLKRMFFSDKPTSIVLSFTGVPNEVNKIAVFYINVRDETGGANHPFEIPDIPFCNNQNSAE